MGRIESLAGRTEQRKKRIELFYFNQTNKENMVILQLVPLSKPVAIAEMVILLILAAGIGWLLAKLIMRGRIKNLRESIEERKMELAACRAFIPDVSVQAGPLVGNASKTVYPN